MNKTKIEYLDFTWNPYTGCWNWARAICKGAGDEFKCWAKRQTEFRPRCYPYGFMPTFYPERLNEPLSRKKPARIGVSFMGDLFGDWMRRGFITEAGPDCPKFWSGWDVIAKILETVRACPQHTFVFLTKCPWNLQDWFSGPSFELENCWVGVSANDWEMTYMAQDELQRISNNVIKFISFEPLLSEVPDALAGLDWVIIGAATRPQRLPELAWVEGIEKAADRLHIPVFEKDNLAPLLGPDLRQEFPEIRA